MKKYGRIQRISFFETHFFPLLRLGISCWIRGCWPTLSLLILGATAFLGPEAAQADVSSSQIYSEISPGAKFSHLYIVWKRGSLYDPVGSEGLARLTGMALLKGGAGLSEDQLQRKLDLLSARVDVVSSLSNVTFKISGLSKDFPEVVNLIASVLKNPSFEESTLQTLISLELEKLRASLFQGDAKVSYLMPGYLHAGGSLSRLPGGTLNSLASLVPENIRQFYANHMAQSELFFLVDSPISAVKFESIINKSAITALPLNPLTASAAIVKSSPLLQSKIVVVDEPRDAYTVAMGFQGPASSDKSYFSTRFAYEIFGQGLGSWMFREIREAPKVPGLTKTITYQANAEYLATPAGGSILMRTAPVVNHEELKEPLATTLGLYFRIIEDFAQKKPLPEEIQGRGALQVGQFSFARQNELGRLEQKWLQSQMGFPLFKSLDALEKEIGLLNSNNVSKALSDWLYQQNFVLIIVGPADKILPQIESLKLNATVEVKTSGMVLNSP